MSMNSCSSTCVHVCQSHLCLYHAMFLYQTDCQAYCLCCANISTVPVSGFQSALPAASISPCLHDITQILLCVCVILFRCSPDFLSFFLFWSFQQHRNQRNQWPFWLRLASALYALLFDGEPAVHRRRQEDRRWDGHHDELHCLCLMALFDIQHGFLWENKRRKMISAGRGPPFFPSQEDAMVFMRLFSYKTCWSICNIVCVFEFPLHFHMCTFWTTSVLGMPYHLQLLQKDCWILDWRREGGGLEGFLFYYFP